MADKHLAQLGRIADNIPIGYKDAMHVAVVRVVAGTCLYPGQRTEIRGDEAFPASRGAYGVGIVDPFLNRRVDQGEAFLLVLDPGTTFNLRHVWDHPDFPDIEVDADNYDDSCRGCY